MTAVIPVYNVELYLRETVESVLAQDMGFKENIQIILVNDGSSDNSEEICLEYEAKYPNNIKYVYQENAGVSCARNNGLQYAEGKYVNFLDSDDKWTSDAYSAVYEFMEEHQDEIDLASCKQIFFEAATHTHLLSKKKFNETRVTNIHNDYDDLQLHVTASFIKTEVAKQFEFIPGMRYGEDALYVNKIILEKQKYGLVVGPTHYYRKRENGSSAVQNKHKAFDWYFETPITFYKELMDISRERFGEVIPYVQNLFMYEMQWRIRENIEEVLDEEQQQEYRNLIRELLLECDDDIISAQEKVYLGEKLFLYGLKYGRDISKEVICMNGKLYFNNIALCNMNRMQAVRIDILDIHEDKMYLEGRIMNALVNEMDFWFEDEDGVRYEIPRKKPTSYGEVVYWGETMVQPYTFSIKLPILDDRIYTLCASYHNYEFELKICLGKFSRLNPRFESMYYECNGFVIKMDHGMFHVYKATQQLEKTFEKELKEEFKGILARGTWSKEDTAAMKKGMCLRRKYYRYQRKERNKVWLISDRIHVAGDNGEAFFRYMQENPIPGVDTYFVISKECNDYKRMKKIGKVIPYKSSKHLFYTMIADKIISSQGEDVVFNPFEKLATYVRSLCHFDYVFLQHGIIKDDISRWLNKYNKNISMFVTSAKPEYEAILTDDYNYDEKVVRLTGLPRYDLLVQEKAPEKSIIFLPTWRPNLAIEMDWRTGIRPYNTEFVKSEYFAFYNALINDERLLRVMKEYGYTGKFCLHPNNMANVGDFTSNEIISVETQGINYRDEFIRNSLLITDYSSVAYDFAYLKKPVIYTQFDRDEFFENAVYEKGYWDYKRDGFGPVCEDYEQAVEQIIQSIKADCKLEHQYEEKIEKFYLAFDHDNSKRVCEAICELDNNSREEA